MLVNIIIIKLIINLIFWYYYYCSAYDCVSKHRTEHLFGALFDRLVKMYIKLHKKY